MGEIINRRRYVNSKSGGRLKFTALSNGTLFTLTIPAGIGTSLLSYIEYSINEGSTWTRVNYTNSYVNITTPTIEKGSSVYWRGGANKLAYKNTNGTVIYSKFGSNMDFEVSGNIMSLLWGDNYANKTSLYESYTFFGLFENSKITTPPELPATTLADYCYAKMFCLCTSLTTAPELPATTLAVACYSNMFEHCSRLTVPPELPALIAVQDCYAVMFKECTALGIAPALPATLLAYRCYNYMFQGCINLRTAPELPATTLADSCYYHMFENCSNLSVVKAAFTQLVQINSSYPTGDWLEGVASSGTFYKNINATWSRTGANGVPSGWTVITYTPD